MRRFIVGSVLTLFAAGLGFATEEQEESLRSLNKRVGTQATAPERETHFQKIVTRIDKLIEPILKSHSDPKEIAAGIKTTFGTDDEDRFDGAIKFESVPGTGEVVIAYDVPIIPAGNRVKVVLRLWTPAGPKGSGAVLRHLDDPGFADAENFPVSAMGFLKHDGEWHLVLLGLNGNGHGKYALSLWSLKESKCVWTWPLEYGDSCCFAVLGEDLFVRIAHNELQNDEKDKYVSEEHFGWSDNGFVDLFTGPDKSPPLCELP